MEYKFAGYEDNSLYLEKNGEPYIGVMGEMHFSRVPRQQWKKALSTMKKGGIEIVSTYIIWIYHELEEGKYDWDGDNDLRTFCQMAKEEGLEVCLRIGPWCHGEVRNGGFPDWLLKKDFELRTNNEGYLAEVKKWYGAIGAQVQGLMVKNGGPITMCQLENELTDNPEHLETLKEMAIAAGIDVPLYTVTGWNAVNGAKIPEKGVLPMFGGYCDAPWDEGVQQLPPCNRYYFTGIRNDSAIGKDIIKEADDDWQLPYDKYPYGTCEIGVGLMNTYHRRYQIQGMDIYAMTMVMLAEGANILGYYMYHGGINKLAENITLQESKATGYPNDYPMISYDFQAPISSYEETRESYDLLNLLHMFVKDYGYKLAAMSFVPAEKPVELGSLEGLRYCKRCNEESGFVFINNYQRLHQLPEIKDVVINAGNVEFPAIDVKSGVSFFMPYNMELAEDIILEYATAQPLCRCGDNWLFLEIPGVKPQFRFKNKSKTMSIIVLNIEEAKLLRKVDGVVFFDDVAGKTNADLKAALDRDYTLTQLDKPAFELPEIYKSELEYSNKPITWYQLKVDGDEGFVDIDIKCDVMQLYVDGQFSEDDFYHGLPWRLPKSILQGDEIYIVTSQYQEESYIEMP